MISDKVCAEKAGVDYMDVIQFLGKDLNLNYVLSKEHTSEGIVILNNDHIYILENPYGVDLNIKIELQDIYSVSYLTFVILMAKAKRISRTRNLNYQGVSVL